MFHSILFILNLFSVSISCLFFLGEIEIVENFYALIQHFILGIFQVFMSLFLFFHKTKGNAILKVHLALSVLYIAVALIVRNTVSHLDEDFSLGVIPCFIAILFTIGYGKFVFGKNVGITKEEIF